ncbi:MAG: hypothetical protein ACR2RV_26120, partial [Verrucomicrobiales bacterium]
MPTYLLLALGLVVFFGDHVADARLGETRGFLRGPEGRYGEPTGETTAVLVGSQETVDVFKKDSIDVTVEYDEDGKAQRITYRKKDLSENLMTNLLQKNGGERKWSKPVRFLENKYWVSLDQEVHAVYYGNPVYKLVVMNRAAVQAERLPQSLQGRETKRVGDGDEEEAKPEV